MASISGTIEVVLSTDESREKKRLGEKRDLNLV